MSLPSGADARKAIPLASGLFDYFPAALAAVAHLSHVGNQQHQPGTPIHWDRSKSSDAPDALLRHFVQRGTVDNDGVRHSVKVAWRALEIAQKELEAEEGAPVPRGVAVAVHRHNVPDSEPGTPDALVDAILPVQSVPGD